MSIVYLLTNESMTGYIKIGRTDTSVEQRMAELDRTSVALPFQCFYAARVDAYGGVERTHNSRFVDLMDKHLPMWRTTRDLLNGAPVADETWNMGEE